MQSARIQHEISLAMRDAQADAVRAQLAQSSTSKDAYGHTLFVAQHEMLNDRLRKIPGVVLRRPAGVRSRFEFPVIDETNVVLVPLRVSSDPRKRRQECRIDMSQLRVAILGVAPRRPDDQRSIDDIEDPDAADQRYAEEMEAFEEMSKAGCAVVIGFGSTVDGIFELGLGELLIEDHVIGEVSWPHWQPLRILDLDQQEPIAPPLHAVRSASNVERFDAIGVDDDLGLRLRPQREESPSAEEEVEPLAAGSEAEGE
ncbi:hypothetical protein [Nocardioides caldifontis]|uniref:hypothetical protein n=1 Tax=Nocardioides caldifontis TaxID=2588938 RepID=UPI0011E04002|nr:hypothetical protein [Nocardioides caldifontis]